MQALASYQLIDIIGKDCTRFLQGQLTTSLDEPTSNKAFLSAVCNPKGRIVSLFHIFEIEQGFRLLVPSTNAENTINHLKKYAVFYKVTISVNNSRIFFAISSNENGHQEPNQQQAISLSNTELRIFIESSVNAELDDKQQDDSQWYSYMVQHGIAWIDGTTSEEFLPHDLNLPNQGAVSFTKGCFTGQEVIARMQYKGKLKQHLSLLSVENSDALEAKSTIFQNEKKVGEVVCFAANSPKGCLVLALVKDKADKSQFFQLSGENPPILKIIE